MSGSISPPCLETLPQSLYTDVVPQSLSSKPDDDWNTVGLFFNLTPESRPSTYKETSESDVENWMQGNTSAAPSGASSISTFMKNYWQTISYDQFNLSGVEVPRDRNGNPLIPTLDVGGSLPHWTQLTQKVLEKVAEEAWVAAGRPRKNGKRWIPSVFLVQNWYVHASASSNAGEIQVNDRSYLIGDWTHVRYDDSWGTLLHEFGHNFIEFGDLYSPTGATLYWDLLGDHSEGEHTSEISSIHKEKAPGWEYDFNKIIKGSEEYEYYDEITLSPFTTSGDSVKVVPDPKNNPKEYFIFEYRTPTGDEPWRPDRILSESGLLIVHINERILETTPGEDSPAAMSWFLIEAPYFDPEFAVYSVDEGGQTSGTHEGVRDDITAKVLFTGEENRNRFAPTTKPNSDFYGGRSSTLDIDDIQIEENGASFSIRLEPIPHQRLWSTSAKDRGVAGQFRSSDPDASDEIFFRNDGEAALLTHNEAKWLVRQHQRQNIDDWTLGTDDWELAADIDGDGRDEIFGRKDNAAGVIQWRNGRFELKGKEQDWVEEWNLGEDDWELAADLDGDGAEEIYIRSKNRSGIIVWENGLSLRMIKQDSIGEWELGESDQEVVGSFTDPGEGQIAILGSEKLGLLEWDTASQSLTSVSVQRETISGKWTVDSSDQIIAADLDGDGLDELYIRKKSKAGVLKWKKGQFRVIWTRSGELKGRRKSDKRLKLTRGDRSIPGQFRPYEGGRQKPKDGILHVTEENSEKRLSLLLWNEPSKALQVESFKKGNLFQWEQDTGLILGDFHEVGPETPHGSSAIINEGTDIFLHNRSGTGTLGIDIQRGVHGGKEAFHPSLFWLQEDYLMGLFEPSVVPKVLNEKPISSGNTLKLIASVRGVSASDEWAIEWNKFENNSWTEIGESKSGEILRYSGVSGEEEQINVQVKATRDGESLSEIITIDLVPGTRTYGTVLTPTNSGILKDDGTVIYDQNTDLLKMGDDEENRSMQAMLTFDLDLPEDLPSQAIEKATLKLRFASSVGAPETDLSELNVVHVDYGSDIQDSDFRTKSLTTLPGFATISDPQSGATTRIDMTKAIEHAWRNREARGENVQFALYYRQATDSDSEPDYAQIKSNRPEQGAPDSSDVWPLLQVRYNPQSA